MINPNLLDKGQCYFSVNYFDRELKIPNIKTLFFIEEHMITESNENSEPVWIFQEAESHYSHATDGYIAYRTLETFFEWEGMVDHLLNNLKNQQNGK